MDPNKNNNKTFTIEKDIIYAFSIFITSILTGILNAVNRKNINLQRGGNGTTAATATAAATSVPANTYMEKKEPDGWLNSFFELVNKINDILLASVNNIANETVDSVVQHTLGDLGKNPKQTILDKLNNGTLIVSQMANDPEVQRALQNLAQELTVISLQMLDTVQPQVNLILEKAMDTLNQTANKSAKGLMSSGMNFVTSLIGNIPVYGGIVSLVMAFLRGFNDASYALSPAVKFNTETVIRSFNTVLKMIQDFNEAADTLGNKIDSVSTAVRGLSTSAASIPTSIKNTALSVPVLPVPTLPMSKLSVPALPVPALPVPTLPVPVPTLPVPNPTVVRSNVASRNIGGSGVKLRNKINHITRRLKRTINRFVKNKKFTRKV